MANIEDVKQKLRGASIAPVITPFKEDGSVDYKRIEELIDWQIKSGSHAISVTSTSGEPSSLSIDERVDVMETAYKAIDGRVPFVAWSGSKKHAETMYLTKKATAIGADAALVSVPNCNKPNQAALYKHFKTVADTNDIPFILYN